MDPEDILVEGHQALRLRLSEMSRLVSGDSVSRDRLGPEAARRLREIERDLSDELRAHEAAENREVIEALLRGGGPGESVAAALSAQHEEIHGIFRILGALARVAGTESAYAIQFTLANVAARLERHFEYEEREALPLLRRLKSPAGSFL